MPFSDTMNPHIYSVECVDGIKPAGKGAKAWLRYPGAASYAAAVYNQADKYRTVTIGVPVETVLRAGDREWILKEALGFLYDGKKPANRK